jgi:hypothetical protein
MVQEASSCDFCVLPTLPVDASAAADIIDRLLPPGPDLCSIWPSLLSYRFAVAVALLAPLV